MSTTTNARLPETEEVLYRSIRGGSILEVRLTTWPDHSTATITIRSNGKTVHASILPREARSVAAALCRAADLRGWR